MSTDRELLELASKATGRDADWVDFAGMDIRVGYQGGMLCADDDSSYYWNPLKSDGDALRLAVKLGLGVIQWTKDVSATHPLTNAEFSQQKGSDPYSATRRAIVLAAAEIGRSMP